MLSVNYSAVTPVSHCGNFWTIHLLNFNNRFQGNSSLDIRCPDIFVDQWHCLCSQQGIHHLLETGGRLSHMDQSKNLIYIVDDDPDDRQIILDAFLEHTNTIDYVFLEDGRELLDTLSSSAPQDHPSLVILDLNMPGMLGLQVLKEIRSVQKYSHIPIVVMTTSDLNSDRKHSYELGANCFLTKPKLYSDLIKITRSIATIWLEEEVSLPIANDDTINI